MNDQQSRRIRKDLGKVRAKITKLESAVEHRRDELKQMVDDTDSERNRWGMLMHELAKAEHAESWISLPDAVDLIMSFLQMHKITLNDEGLNSLDEFLTSHAVHTNTIRNQDIPGILVTYNVNSSGDHVCKPYNKALDHDKQAIEAFFVPVNEERLFKLLKHDSDL